MNITYSYTHTHTLLTHAQILTMDFFQLLIQLLLIAGAINWGLVAFYNFDLVNYLTSWEPKNVFWTFERIIKIAVGVAGVAALVYLLT